MIIGAAALLGANAAKEFAHEVLTTIQNPVSDTEFVYALTQLLAAHDSSDILEELQNIGEGKYEHPKR